ncbi:hypothetical protein [Alteribacillus sp. YIM 98480]|uniref:hypothetical protein n=1 Tax=Alteribacillus sp. YIM 98480 TaxID=2606599 RepID=UPI00131D39B4|nr:hypothetical protein [Alteribacillus sp. YIM 98480]
MSSSSAYSLEIPSVRQWKAKISFPYAAPPGLVAHQQGACTFLMASLIKGLDSLVAKRMIKLHGCFIFGV